MTVEDLPWLYYLCRKRYADDYTPTETEGWFRNSVLTNAVVFFPIRTNDAFLIAHLHVWPWKAKEFTCDVMFICADDGAVWQALSLVRASIAWAESRKAAVWRISSETEIDVTPLALRVGAKKIGPRCELDLRKAA